ncbi:helix-turn-helix transcriptional regulator [Pseudomonas sp. BIGb0427]|nr:AraC family transcriptional regulator [Pseudomonas sp. BIGb0427]QPG62538.1 helix-turn-helix transcriptional regulator [Pseudomonas sp. BIGb0427]
MYSSMTRKQIILRSDSMHSDDFGAVFSSLFGNLYADIPPLPGNINIGGVYGRHDGVSFRRMHYRGDFTFCFPESQDEITFVIPSSGTLILNPDRHAAGFRHMGLAIDKADVRSMRLMDDHDQCGISIRRALFTERLATLLGKPILGRLYFEPVVPLAHLQGIRALVELATGSQFDLLLHAGALMPARLQEMLVDALLEIWPHNFSQALQRPAPMIAPRHVKLAIEYLQAHPHSQVSGTELARVCNVSLRALQDGFRRFMGLSIVAYQRQLRLEHAHHALRQRGAASVTEVALASGFSNVGRFCQYFHSAFGVSPADVRNGAGQRRRAGPAGSQNK